MKVKYITIEREYGSGGSKIAEEVASRCGIACYGREIMEMAAHNQHVSVEDVERYEETASSSLLYSFFVMGQVQSGETSDVMPMESRLYVEEHEVIRTLARKGPAVFVGHCASEALEDEQGVLRVFIRAEEWFKRARAIEHYGISEREADAVCRRYNKKRANYYAFNTAKKWDDLSNYDIVLDSSTLGIEGCVKVLAALMQ